MAKAFPGSSVQSAASEAVFSKDGIVKKRIKNFETTVVEASDNVLVFPPKQTNNDEIDIPEILETVSAVGNDTNSTKHTPRRRGTALVSFIVVITFSWSIYSLFFSVKQPTELADTSDDIQLQDIDKVIATSDNFENLKQSANLLISKTSWKSSDIDSFLKPWNQLNEQQIQKVIATSWYHLLEYNVKKQLALVKTQNSAKSKSEQSLMTLGLVMGIMDQENSSDPQDTTNSPGNNKYQQLLAELTDELVDADKRSKKFAQTMESETSLYEKLRKEYASNKPLQRNEITVTQQKLTKVAKAESNIKKPLSSSGTPIRNITINKNEIEAMVRNYKTAYEKGDLSLMAKLFGTSSKEPKSFDKVAKNFQSTFKNTKNRSINFYDTETHVTADEAIIETKFNASVEFNSGKGIQYTVANAKFYLVKNNNQVKFNRIDLLNKKVNVIAREQTRPTSSHGMLASLDNKVTFPTPAELQDITTQLVTSYETGNLEQFLSLFAAEIKTNDRIDITGVKQDYSELFKSTSDRQMFIQNLKWSNEKIGAKGTGDLEVVILSDEGSTVYSMEGKIQIVAQKIDNQVKITHLYHIEREK